MTTYYVGAGGNNANAGTSWALRKLTLNGAEDIPVAAGDTVYVGPGAYRESLTVDVSGSAGNPITYIGDYSGANTDGVGGIVRITGSNNDLAVTRANVITATSKHYRTFIGFQFDTTSATAIGATTCTDWIVDKCMVYGQLLQLLGATSLRWTIRNCTVFAPAGLKGIQFFHSATVDNSAHAVENCLLMGGHNCDGIAISRIGGITIRNNTILFFRYGIINDVALTGGQTETVNNNIIAWCNVGISAISTAEIPENYNTIFQCTTARSNTSVGANSNAYPPLFDARWFNEAAAGGTLVTPFDLSASSQLINVAGTSPTTTDMRGASVIGSQREWGPLEYNSALSVSGGSALGLPIVGSAIVRGDA